LHALEEIFRDYGIVFARILFTLILYIPAVIAIIQDILDRVGGESIAFSGVKTLAVEPYCDISHRSIF